MTSFDDAEPDDVRLSLRDRMPDYLVTFGIGFGGHVRDQDRHLLDL